jgi:hypothetical protein
LVLWFLGNSKTIGELNLRPRWDYFNRLKNLDNCTFLSFWMKQ